MPKNVKNTTLPGLFDLLAPHSCRGCGRIGTPLCNRCKNYIISAHSTYDPHLPVDFLDSLNNNFVHSSTPVPPSPDAQSSAQHTAQAIAQPTAQLPARSSARLSPTQSPVPSIFVLGPRTGLIGKLITDLKYHSVRALAESLAELLDATLPDYKGSVSIVPLPTNSQHVRARGLDHTFLIAKRLARLRGKHYRVERLLLRAQNTTQVGASEAQRRSQALSAYETKPGVQLDPSTTYLLLDDVWTTGASMQAALHHFSTLHPQKFHLVLLARN